MALQIEAPETIRLLEVLSQPMGESVEVTLEAALRERLERLRLSEAELQRRAEAPALVNEIATLFRESGEPAIDHGELLYGEDGLPR